MARKHRNNSFHNNYIKVMCVTLYPMLFQTRSTCCVSPLSCSQLIWQARTWRTRCPSVSLSRTRAAQPPESVRIWLGTCTITSTLLGMLPPLEKSEIFMCCNFQATVTTGIWHLCDPHFNLFYRNFTIH